MEQQSGETPNRTILNLGGIICKSAKKRGRDFRGGLLLTLLVLLCAEPGCIGSFSSSRPPEYFQLDYAARSSSCTDSLPGAVRVWAFSAAAPFDSEQMVMIDEARQVRFSSHFHWVATPGDMLADKLIRDLSSTHLFEDAVPVGSPVSTTYAMSGNIYRFAFEKSGSESNSVLDLEISLWQEKPARAVLFRKHYHYQSPPIRSTDPDDYAKAMAEAVSRLSYDLRNDLCIAIQDSLHRAADSRIQPGA